MPPPARRKLSSETNLPELTRDEMTQVILRARKVKAGLLVRLVVEPSRRRGTLRSTRAIWRS